ncbi:MAG: (2Fe-2S)-binding protein [Gammaproteobacteria bacterium]
MKDSKPPQKRDYICHCSGTTQEKIEALIENGADDIDTLSRLTGASLGCGACETAILEFLADSKQSRQTSINE